MKNEELNNDYYGDKKGETRLEIYSTDNDGQNKVTHRLLTDQEAYDTWHLSYYFKELLEWNHLKKIPHLGFDMLPRKEKIVVMYYLMLLTEKKLDVLEFGSSLLEIIDGLEVFDSLLKSDGAAGLKLSIKDIDFAGIELSEMLTEAGLMLHKEYNIKMFRNVSEYIENGGRTGILYDRNVSSYAFNSSKALAEFINTSETAYLNLFVSKGETFNVSRLGKSLTYFSVHELAEYLDKPLYHLFGEKCPGADLAEGRDVVEGFFMCCTEEFAERFKKNTEMFRYIKDYFAEKNINPVRVDTWF